MSKEYAVVDEMGFLLTTNTHRTMKAARREAQRVANRLGHDVAIDAAHYNRDHTEVLRVQPAVAIVRFQRTSRVRRSR